MASDLLADVTLLLRGVLDLIAPPRCVDCDAPLDQSVQEKDPFCWRCRAKLSWLACRCDATSSPCDACHGYGSEVTHCRAAVDYASGAEAWLRRFKYPRSGLAGLDPRPTVVARRFITLAAARRPGPPPDWVLPVPLHARRLRQRGFNPSTLLARAAAHATGSFVPRLSLLVRQRDTPSQTRLDRGERRRNVAGAFAARRCEQLQGRQILLVDDIATTGATLREAARELLRAGASGVDAVCAARTGLHRESERELNRNLKRVRDPLPRSSRS
jgi:ComF family protein